jgi:cell division protein FtsW (lipid II flippase)
VALREAGSRIAAPQRNLELLLLAASAGFIVLAWRALDAAAFAMPEGSGRILTQFLVVALAGHAGLRVAAPGAAGQPYAIAMLLGAIGLAFVTRLAPGSAVDQANWLTLGVLVMLVTAGLSSRYAVLRELKYTAAMVAVLLMLLTGLFGDTIGGARLWISVAGQSIQTTELIKVFLLLFLAGYLAEKADVLSAPRLRFAGRSYSALPYLLPLALIWLVALLALAWLKDLGALALLLMLAVAALYVATGQKRFVAGGVLLLVFTAFAGYSLFDHAQQRIDAWRDPWSQSQDTGYQTVQSLYSFEAGGVTGEGLGLGMPRVIPAVQTDYIFAAIGEELGLAGATGVVLLYALLVVAGLRIALEARSDYEGLLASLVALLIGIQAAVIIAGNLRLIPTTGITLPFVSYGGSSLVVNFLLLGLLLGISDRARRGRQA